jgi:uncharacterized protein (DUF885 family)
MRVVRAFEAVLMMVMVAAASVVGAQAPATPAPAAPVPAGQAPATTPAATDPAATAATAPAVQAEPPTAANTALAAGQDEGNPVPVSPFPTAPPTPGDLQLRAIHKADILWRRSQRGGLPWGRQLMVQPSVLPAVDEATQQKKLEHYLSVKAQLEKLPRAEMAESEVMDIDIYLDSINREIDEQKFKEYQRPVTSLRSPWSEVQNTGQLGFRTEKDYANYLEFLADIPRYYGENITNMRAGMKRGFMPPKVAMNDRVKTISLVANAASAEDTPFWRPFKKMPGTINTAEQARLRAVAKKLIETTVLPEYKTLLVFWNDEYYPNMAKSIAASDLPDGKAYYQSRIKRFTTLDMTPEEIHALGLAQMAMIHQEMLDTMKEAKFDGDFPAFLKFLRTDPQFYAKTPEELMGRVALMMSEFNEKADRYFGYMSRSRFGVHEFPVEVAPFVPMGSGGVQGYSINTYDLPERGLYSMPSLTLHEAAPGHAWDFQMRREHDNPDGFRGQNSGFSEGWALYCERLGTEMGMYHTPYEKFGMLSFQAWRASRLVVDTGMHAMGMTRAEAQQYLRDNTALGEHDIEEEIDRYISWPGQALAYYLGMTEIQKERKHAQQALGRKFNLRAFHDAILATGGVPLPVLDEYLEAWIKGGGIGPYPELEK